MHGEDRGGGGARPNGQSQSAPDEEENRRVQRMQQSVHEKVGGGVHAEDRDDGHVREIDQRLPVDVADSEGLANAVRGEARADVFVLGDENRVVEINELEGGGLRVKQQREE